MTGKYFNFSEVLDYGWRVMKANFWFFVGLGFVFLIVTYIPTIIDIMAVHILSRSSFAVVNIATTILGWVINVVLGIGLIKIALSFCDERKPPIGTLFDVWDCLWRYVGVAILYGLIITAIIVLCSLPVFLPAARLSPLLLMFPVGLVFAVRFAIQFGLCFYFVVDKDLGPVQALKASGRTTMGAKWLLLGFGILCVIINLLGLLCLIVGILATYPMVIVANALVYRQLAAQTPELAEFGIAAPTVEPAPEPQPNGQQF